MGEKKVIIIGAGLGGLAVGSYLQMNGYSTHILEMANQSGGVAVTWQRKGYTFDGATNYLPGSSPDFNIHYIIGEILDLRKIKFYDYPEFIRVEYDNEAFHVYTDAEKLKKEMLRLAPEDKQPVNDFISAIKKFGSFDLPFEKAPETFNLWDGICFLKRFFPLILFRQKWGKFSVEEYAQRFKNARMRTMFKQIFPHHEHFSVMGPIAPLAWMNYKKAGYPMGGSSKIITLSENRYKSLGGTVEFKKQVTGILIENNSVTGVSCIDGSKYRADIVVSAADRHATLFNLLPQSHVPQKAKRQFSSLLPFSAIVQVSLGIARSFEGEAEKMNIPLIEPLTIGTFSTNDMMVRICNFDPSFAPEGKTSVIVQLRTDDSSYWENLRKQDREKYKSEKKRVASLVIASLEKRFGAVKKNIEVVDVATPATYIRYINLWKAAHQGWAPTPDAIGRLQKKRIPGLNNFYLAGHWVSPAGGIPAVIAVGRHVAQMICKKDRKQFVVKGYE